MHAGRTCAGVPRVGVHLTKGVDVDGVEEAAAAVLGGVAESPERGSVGHRKGALDGETDPVLVANGLHHLYRLRHAAHRVLLQPQAEGEVEEHLRVGRSLDVRVPRRVDGEREVALDRCEVGQCPVVHEEPVRISERVTVRLLDRRGRGGAHVAEEQRRLDRVGQLAEVLVVPCRFGAVKDPRLRTRL